MSSLKKVFQNSFLYSFSNVLLRATSIIFFPIFSSYLNKSDYGVLSVSQTIIVFTSIFAGLELTKSVTRFIYKKNEVKLSADTLISNTLFATLVSNTIILVPMILFGAQLLRPMLSDIQFYPAIFWSLISVPFKSLIDVYRIYLKANHEGKKAFLLDMGFFGCNIALNLLFVIEFNLNAFGIILSTFVSSLIFIVILWVVFYRKITYSINKEALKIMLEYAVPLIPFAVLNSLLDSTDKMFLNSKYGSADSGLYYISITFAGIFSVTKESISSALTPWIFDALNTKPVKQIRDVIIAVFLGTGFLAIGTSWFSREVLMILSSNASFIEAYKYIPMLVSGLYVIFLGQLFNIKTFYYGTYSRYLFLSTFVGIVVSFVSCYVFIENYKMGVKGAAIARFFAYISLVIAAAYLSRLEKEKNEIFDLKILIGICVTISTLIFLPVVLNVGFIVALVVKIVLAILIGAVMFLYLNRKFKIAKLILDKLNIGR